MGFPLNWLESSSNGDGCGSWSGGIGRINDGGICESALCRIHGGEGGRKKMEEI